MTDRRTLTLVLALAVAGTLAFPSAAASLFAGPTDVVGNDVSLAPSSEYASLDDDGKLVVDISASNPNVEGVNPDSVTSFADVFRIRYSGSEYARVWLEDGSDAVTFTVDGRPIDSAADNVTLAPNQSVAVSLTVDTTDADAVVDGITVRSRVAEPETEATADDTGRSDGFATQSVAPTARSRRFTAVGAGSSERVDFDTSRLELDRIAAETLTFDSLSVSSPNRSFSVTAAADGTERPRSLVADAGAEPLGAVRMAARSGTITGARLRFSVSSAYFDRRGVDPANLVVYRYSDDELSRLPVTMTGRQDGRIAFAAETSGFSTFVVAVDRPRLRLANASVDTTTVAPGESVTVTAAVSNDGTLAGERTVDVAVDGNVVAERTVAVSPSATETVSVPVVRNASGEYRVTVDGADAGSFRVTAPATPTPSAGDDPEATDRATQPPVAEPGGFGLQSLLGLLGLLLIVGATLALARRTPRP